MYFYQVQCQLGLTGLDWLDVFCYVSDCLCVREFFLTKISFKRQRTRLMHSFSTTF